MAAYEGPTSCDLAPDHDQVLQQLAFWFEECMTGDIDIGWIDPAAGKLNQFRRFDARALEACADFVVETNAEPGQSMYFRPALVQPSAPLYVRDEHFLAAPGPWADLDDDHAVRSAPDIYAACRPNMVVVTGRHPHKREQMFWRHEGALNDAVVLRDSNRRLAARLGGDSKVVNPTSLMRVAGTIAWPWKPGRVPELTELVLFDDDRPKAYPLAVIESAFPPMTTAKLGGDNARQARHGDGGLELERVSVEACIEAIRAGDHWHNNMVRLTGHWIGRGWSNVEILTAAEALTLPGHTIEQTRHDVARMIQGGRAKWITPNPLHAITADDSPAARPPIIDPTLWADQPVPHRAWLIEDWMPMRYVTALYGDGGLGKTLLAHMLLTSIATGHAWLGLPVRRLKAFGLLCEDHEEDLHIGQDRINTAYSITYHQLGDLRLWSSVGFDNLLMTFDGGDGGAGLLTGFFATLLEAIKCFGARFVVLDTAADLFGGNEINRSQVRQFVAKACGRIAREIDGAVLLCAHPSLSGLTSGTGTGGSTAWNNTVRSRLYLSATKGAANGEEADPDLRLLTRKKANFARAGESILLRWIDGVLVPVAAEEADHRALQVLMLDEIERAWDEGSPYSDAPQARSRYVLTHLPRRLQRSPYEVELAYFALLDRGCLRVDLRDRHANQKGLRVVKRPGVEGEPAP